MIKDKKHQNYLLYAITDRRWLKPGETLYSVTRKLLEGGVTMLQLREKNLPDAAFLEEAKQLAQLCQAFDVPLLINDRPLLAKAAAARGVHLGQSDMEIREARKLLGEKAIIGGTAHNLAEAMQAQAAGADYLGCGAVFTTDTKTDTVPLAKEELRTICSTVQIPVVAIGGIDETNMEKLEGTGVQGFALIHALYGAADPYQAALRLRKKAEQLAVKK